MTSIYKERLAILEINQNKLVNLSNDKQENGNGIFDRYKAPVLTNAHVPLNGILANFLLMKEITSYFNTNTSFIGKPCSQQVLKFETTR